MTLSLKGRGGLAALLGAITALILPASAEVVEERVRQAALTTYFHGMTDEIAADLLARGERIIEDPALLRWFYEGGTPPP